MPWSLWVNNLFILISLDWKYADYQLCSKEFLRNLEGGEICEIAATKTLTAVGEWPLPYALFCTGPRDMGHTRASQRLSAPPPLGVAG